MPVRGAYSSCSEYGDRVLEYYEKNVPKSSSRIARNIRVFDKNIFLRFFMFFRKTREIEYTFPWGVFRGIIPEHVSSAVYKYGYFDKSVGTLLACSVRPGDTVFDVGAHFGYFTVMSSFLVGEKGRVYSFEAITSTYNQLLKNTEVLDNVFVDNFAVSDEAGELEFNDFGLVNSSLNSSGYARTRNITGDRVIVECVTLDKYFEKVNESRVDVVKIDVESMEQYVLAGAKKLFAHFRPTTIVEIGARSDDEKKNIDSVMRFFIALGYEKVCLRGEDMKLMSISEKDYEYDNVLFADPARCREILDTFRNRT